MDSTYINYNNVIVDNTGRFIDIEKTRNKPNVILKHISLPYTFIMYDPDAPNKFFIHWLIINGKTIIDYIPPNPPKNETHRYIFKLYEGIPENVKTKNFNELFDKMKCVNKKYFKTKTN